jgi:hypothetical protein
MAFNSAIIMKPKKFKGSDKVKSSKLQGVDELLKEPSKKNETEESYEGEKLKGTDKVPATPFKGTMKPKNEDILEIDFMLSNAKKSSEVPKDKNAYDKEAGYFKVDKDEAGMFKESGESAKKKYLNKLKSRKGM